MTRLSHSYCRACDIIFQAAARCPRCYGYDLVKPPTGSPRVPHQNDGRGRRRWIEQHSDYPAELERARVHPPAHAMDAS